jgi:outer membrane protein assembly factor BamE (lipoprotein component of BamABCDE complex)
MNQLKKTFVLLNLVFIAACKEIPQLENFDKLEWTKDRQGCQNLRRKHLQSLENQRDKFKGLGQNQVMQLLGKPDIQELYNRNQRFYVYFYEKGSQCEGKADIINGKFIKIRISALDAVTEVLIQK